MEGWLLVFTLQPLTSAGDVFNSYHLGQSNKMFTSQTERKF